MLNDMSRKIPRFVPEALLFRLKRRLLRDGARFMARTPFELRRRLPAITIEPLELVLDGLAVRQETITVLQIGACDGTTNDPIRHRLGKNHIQAVLVEPNPFAFARLQKAYEGFVNVTLIQCAIGEEDGEAHLYRVRRTENAEPEVDKSLQIASFYPDHLERHGKSADEIERITVPCRSLGSLVAELGLKQIHLLQIDVEGFDAAVVRMALKMPIHPGCINFEHVHLRAADREPLFDLLIRNGYILGYDEWNILALQPSLLRGGSSPGTNRGC